MDRPLLMIPGPIECSPGVLAACGGPPPGHLAPVFMEAMGRALRNMRAVWRAGEDSQPFILAGSGTIAMEMAVGNALEPGRRALLVNTGYFSDRFGEMARRRGAEVLELRAAPALAPTVEALREALDQESVDTLLLTHVDTSTGVRIDLEAFAREARARGILTIVDGVCATAAERCEQKEWGVDVYLTGSQKAIGLPAGLALLVSSPAALERRTQLKSPPSLALDYQEWLPIMRAYEEGRPGYFSTPATNLVQGLDVGLEEILDAPGAMEEVFTRHETVAASLRAGFKALGLSLWPAEDVAAHTLSALLYPEGIDKSLLGKIAERGVVVAGGLYPDYQTKYFRIGHMGYSARRKDQLALTLDALAGALIECGHSCDARAARAAFNQRFSA